MTVDNARTAVDILVEDPEQRLYAYQRPDTDRVLYAIFPHGQYDDMAWAPSVFNPVLLYDHGRWTTEGSRWMTEKWEGTA